MVVGIQTGALVKDSMTGQVWAVVQIYSDGSVGLQRNGVIRTANLSELEVLDPPRVRQSSPPSSVAKPQHPLGPD